MKKLLLFVYALAIVISLKSQDIYNSGSFTNPEGTQMAAVFKNGGVIFRDEQPYRDLYSSAMIIDTLSGDIYWSVNSNPSGLISSGYGCVKKNNDILLDNVLGTCVNDIAMDGGDIYAAGYMNDIYNSVAAVWKNGDTTPLYTYCNDKTRSQVLDIEVVDGVVYACGYYEDILNYGCVWVNGDLYASYPYSTVSSIAYHDGDIYYTISDCTTMVYKSGEKLYDLQDFGGTCNEVNDIKVVNDDVYTVGFMGFIDCYVWQNATSIYYHPFGRDADLTACQLYDNCLYYAGWDHNNNGTIFKDGVQLYSYRNCAFYSLCVRPAPLAVAEVEADNSSVTYIYDIFGNLVKTVYSDGNQLDTSDLPSGFYIAKTGSSVVKFIKHASNTL